MSFAEVAVPTAVQIAGVTAQFFVAAAVVCLAVAIAYLGCVFANWVRRHYSKHN